MAHNYKPSLIRGNNLEDTSSSAEIHPRPRKELTTATHDSSLIKDNEGECSREGFFEDLWREVVKMINYTPQNHRWQDKMVRLLGAIKDVPRSDIRCRDEGNIE